MKQMLVGTAVGKIALAGRDRIALLHTALFCPEAVGMLANDQLATALATSLCRPNKIFMDVGAHIGSVIAAVMQHDPSIKIIGFEAMPEKIAKLRRKFPSIDLHGCAVGNLSGEVSFFINQKQSGYSSLARPSNVSQSTVKEIRVPIRKIDELVTSDQVDVMKIDVEGAELGVLQGGEALILKSRPTIMFESAPIPADDSLGYTKEAMWEWLNAHDYLVLVPNRVAHIDPGLSCDGFLESHRYPRRTTNYFAIPKERHLEIRHAARRVLNMSVSC